MTLAELDPEQGLLLSGCPKLDKADLLSFLLKCETNVYDLKNSVISRPRPGDVYLVASSAEQPLNVTEEFLSFKPSKTRQPVTFKGTAQRLLKSYYDLGVKPGDSKKYDYTNAQFKKQTIILDNRKSNAVIVYYYSNTRQTDQANYSDQTTDTSAQRSSTSSSSTRSALRSTRTHNRSSSSSPTRSSLTSSSSTRSTRLTSTRTSSRSSSSSPTRSSSASSPPTPTRSPIRSSSTESDQHTAPIPQTRKPHGNSRSNTNYFSTLSSYQKSSTTEFVKNAKGKSRVKIYEGLVNHAVEQNAAGSIANLPRNTNQVKYEKAKQAAELVLHTDECMGVLSQTLSGLGHFLYSMRVYPEVEIVLAHPGAIQLAKRILKDCGKKRLPHLLSYDDTFNLSSSCYISMLSMKNTELHGEPAFVVCFLAHSKRTKDCHKRLFDDFVTTMLDLNEYTCIISDREKAIIGAINDSLNAKGIPNNLLFCHLHVVRDIRFWSEGKTRSEIEIMRKKFEGDVAEAPGEPRADTKLGPEDEEKMQEAIRKIQEKYNSFAFDAVELCRCERLEDLRKSTSKLSPNWPVNCREYFFNCIEPALENNLLKLNKSHLHEFIARPTNNQAEGVNSSVKKFCGEPNLRLDALSLLLYRYISNMIFNFNRAYSRSGGDYSLSDQLKNLNSDRLASYQLFSKYPTRLDPQIKELKAEVLEARKQETRSRSQLEIANMCVEEGLVSMDAKSKTFNVQSPFDEFHFGAVKFVQGKLICICPINKVCFHRLAVELLLERDEISLGSFDFDFQTAKRNFEISNSKRYERGGKKGPERQPPKSIFDKFTIRNRKPSSKAAPKGAPKADPKAAPKPAQRNRLRKAKVNLTKCDEESDWEPSEEDEVSAIARELEKSSKSIRSSLAPSSSNQSLPSMGTYSMFSSGTGEVEPRDVDLIELSDDEEYYKYNMLTDRVAFDELEEKKRLCDLAESRRWYEGSLINYYIADLISKEPRFFAFHPKLFYHPNQQFLHSITCLDHSHEVLLVPFNTEPGLGRHWCLGLVHLESRKIAILNSMIGSLNSYEVYFKKLLVTAILYLKPRNRKVKPDKWSFHLVSDAPQQPASDSWSCGPIVCFNAKTTVSGDPGNFTDSFKTEVRSSIERSDLREVPLAKADKFQANLTKKLRRFCKVDSYLQIKSRAISEIGFQKFLAFWK